MPRIMRIQACPVSVTTHWTTSAGPWWPGTFAQTQSHQRAAGNIICLQYEGPLCRCGFFSERSFCLLGFLVVKRNPAERIRYLVVLLVVLVFLLLNRIQLLQDALLHLSQLLLE
mmetsp:Transcript_10449/g.27773  ORF Transcript_10449/g.27773 Transcript_10449/m.27773 type:complete len:114 (+) Transcript_10449:650-991(+)